MLDTALQRAQELLIYTHIGEVAVKLQSDRESKAQSRKADDEKGVPDILVTNLTYLLRLGQISEHKDPPPSGRSLRGPRSVST